MFRGYTVVDPASVLTTHLTEVVRENMAELLSYAETQKLLDELPREQQKLVADLSPPQITVGGVQRVLQALLAERVSIRDLRDHPGGHPGGVRRREPVPSPRSSRMSAPAWRARSATATPAPRGYIPLVTLSPEWETAFAEALVGPPEDRQLAMAPSRLQEFMQPPAHRLRRRGGTGRRPVLLTSGAHPRPRARDRRAHPAEHAGACPGRDPPARPHPHRGDGLIRRELSAPLRPGLGRVTVRCRQRN